MTAARPPIWPKVPAPFVRAVLAGHSALGLAFAALIFLVCFSGAAAVFLQEFQRWERPADPRVEAVSPQAVQRGLEEGLRLRPQVETLFLNLPAPGLPRFQLMAYDGTDSESWALDADGRVVAERQAPWSDFVQNLHIALELPPTWGRFVVGATGVALLSSLISGLLAHPRIFRDAFHLRRGGSKRLEEADLHNRIGVWALPFHVVIALTGALLGLATIIVGVLALVVFKGDVEKAYALFATPEPAHDSRPAPPPDLPAMLATVARIAPDAAVTYVMVETPRQGGQHINIGVERPRRLSREAFGFDRSGRLLGGAAYGARNLGERLFTSIGTVHFGWFGGLPVKIAYGLLGAGLTAVTASGVSIWLARRRDKGRPAPRWERIWVAAVWSQPPAYAAAALTALLGGPPPLAAWAAATLAALALAARLDVGALSRGLRGAGACALAAAAAVHAAHWAGRAIDPAAWAVDAALLGLALLLVVPEAVGLLATGRRLRDSAAGAS
jgi:uncharacterized iron-regulated membrane protein